jgi:ribonuclease G
MKALFVDIGLEKNAYLDFNDLLYNDSFRSNYHVGQEIIVQVKKNPIDEKGAKVSEKISISSNHLVLLPYDENVFISKKISDARYRYELKESFESVIDNTGVIVRTNAKNKPFEILVNEYALLCRQWQEIMRRKTIKSNNPLLYKASSDYDNFITDYISDLDRIIVNSKEIYEELCDKYSSKLTIDFKEDLTLKNKFMSFVNQNIKLDNGIHLNIEQTEALTIVDVNSGKYISEKDLNGIYTVNSIALKEIVRQLNLKSISGIVLIDLINFSNKALEKKLVNELKNWLKNYKHKYNVFGFTKTGLLELTKQYTHKDLLSMLTNRSSRIINNISLNYKYFADLLISQIKQLLINTNSRKIGIYCDEATVNFLKNEQFIQDYFIRNNLIIEYNISDEVRIKHLPYKKEV